MADTDGNTCYKSIEGVVCCAVALGSMNLYIHLMGLNFDDYEY